MRVAISAEDGMGAPKASQVASSESLLDVIEEEGLLGHADVMGRYLIKVLEDLQSTFHQIEAVSSRGLRASFDCRRKQTVTGSLAACLDENLISARPRRALRRVLSSSRCASGCGDRAGCGAAGSCAPAV